jgi:cell division protein FtsI (penicillin-binding protein 3)
VLTIDQSLQYEVERVLGERISATGSHAGMAIVTDPSTGEILAMANMAAGTEGEPPRPSTANMALTNVFEPGSVNKVITVAAALELGLVNPDTVIDTPARLPVSVHTFSDVHEHAPAMSVRDIVVQSSNVGTIKIAQMLGRDRIDHYLREFGFGTRTAVGFPGESGGILLPPENWVGTSIGSIPIGQGIAVTALQMLEAYNTIANDGVHVASRLVKATVDHDGTQHDAEPSARRRVVSERTARQVRDMLADVVRAGTGQQATIDGYTVAGKTGTARKPLEDARGYKPGAYMATFAGFVPAEKPALSIIVVLDEPSIGGYYASTVAAPVFGDIARYALRQFHIPPPAGTVVAPAP